MMVDFEDRMPARPLFWGERVLVGITGAMSAYGLVAFLLTFCRAVAAFAR